MSGVQMMVMGVGSGQVTNPLSASASNTAPGGGSSTAQVSLATDGTMTGSVNYSGPSNWYTPTLVGVGANYWVSFDGGAWLQLSSVRSTSLTGTNAAEIRTVRIATDAGGANIVATGSITLQVSNSA